MAERFAPTPGRAGYHGIPQEAAMLRRPILPFHPLLRRPTPGLLLAGVLALLCGSVPARAGSEASCLGARLGAAARLADGLLAREARAARRGGAPDVARLALLRQRFADRVARAEAGGSCPAPADVGALEGELLRLATAAVDAVGDPGPGGSRCASEALRAVGRRTADLLRAHARLIRTGSRDRMARDAARRIARFDARLTRAAGFGDCPGPIDAVALEDLAETVADFALDRLDAVGLETRSIPSSARPPGTPGSPGTDASGYPSLLAQFGGPGVDLNRAVYTRHFYRDGEARPDAILILVPGFEGGAGGFHVLARNLITRAREAGFALEVWAFDRRSHLLEDLEGLQIAEASLDATIALDWLFGDALGLPLHPALAGGPGRRAVFHDAQADTAFLAGWTPLVISRDIDAVVEVARATARGANVFLGGHSAGTGFTARYAATDFDLSGTGPPRPGYAKLRGIVLFEGGGGSVPSAPPSEDTLDRIEAKFDGGLFGAVRDGAARCVDGVTPCTLATEAVDCAGQVPPVCTPPTTAYAIVPGLLNPILLATGELVAIQGAVDPDSGQTLLQVDQGAAGNNALAKVPELGGLGLILPPTTAFGATGSFVDDDGFPSSLASFVRTSVGGPGPVVDGLLTWQEITEGPLPASLLPDNGPKPTTLADAFDEWGVEKETLRLTRVNDGFFRGGTNFTDWYYPSSGLGTTSVSGVCTAGVCTVGDIGATCGQDRDCNQSLGLDSTPLSVGRGRRDIENLTQAGNIDIPVICFGGSNGLTPTPASYLGFARSIGACAAPSCDGTPRIVDESSPNEAFPTLGEVAGGFEVHISEGLAHVDVIAAEDDSQSEIYGPLVDFLIRNAP